jgi:CRISP-associated protein Cas1
MIKRTLYFGNPTYLSLRHAQLVIRLPEVEKNDTLPETFKKEAVKTIPVEDIGVVVLDHKQITITQALLGALLDNNAAVITCDDSRLPSGLMLPLAGNTLQTERFRAQIDASQPLKKNLWQQTVSAKIANQAALLAKLGKPVDNMKYWSSNVLSGDQQNHEARAAAWYWKNLFPPEWGFLRERNGIPPNNLLNYGYALLRAVVARGLVSSGLLPTLGIHHRNKYNAYCLADDIMEPYRPFVDEIVVKITRSGNDFQELTKEIKQELLGIPVVDIHIGNESSPLMVGLQRTTASLARCFQGEVRKIVYPELK